ncbi:MAG: hypothetical protein DI536_13010 [Archangium gephyra]|uniref:Uncharacterized protein n=1 Tax=Archangium gephyra TaxID=48 RepID=A0A2W5TIW2_9BACT|nr:MAG: hypothetical protein DI536_13010 [Archangium gephyra]
MHAFKQSSLVEGQGHAATVVACGHRGASVLHRALDVRLADPRERRASCSVLVERAGAAPRNTPHCASSVQLPR